MDMVRDTSTAIYKMQENTETEYTNLFLVYDSEKESIDVKTVSEYAKCKGIKRRIRMCHGPKNKRDS